MPRPRWLVKVLELPSNPDAIKPTSVEEGTGKVSKILGMRFVSRNKYEYDDIPPATNVSLSFDPLDLRDYTLEFEVPKSFDVPATLAMKKLCDDEEQQTFMWSSNLVRSACVTVESGEKTDTTNEVTIESMFTVRRNADAGFAPINPDRCGCP